ncbi:MAG: hypothetical protein EOP46_08135 [Sphingobacteriaceae bacterium]|nr:MAG: hypothetical protein EOP46_08135 [Sphingobacteriaceae bacterium]
MKMMKYIAGACLLLAAVTGCKKYDDDYKRFLSNEEVTYPGLAQEFFYNTGNQRVQLLWKPSPDPSIVKYVFTWNNGIDSVVVNADTHNPADTMKVIIPNLEEYVYSFKMVIYDDEGHPSIGQELNNVRVYGATYSSGLRNRGYDLNKPYEFTNEGKLKLNFTKADTSELAISTTTTIQYTNALDLPVEVLLPAADYSIILADYKSGTVVRYQSSYKPSETAIDDFAAPEFDEFPEIFKISMVNKSGFSAVHLPGDIGSAYGWELRYIWDGNTGEPGFHTPGQDFPFWFTFDMGQEAALTSLKIWQRQSGIYNYGNPKRFEIWGSNNPNADGSWDSWTKLQEFTTVKPSGQPRGQNSELDIQTAAAGDDYNFGAPTQKYRYIRFKVLECWDGNYFHILELSMFQRE